MTHRGSVVFCALTALAVVAGCSGPYSNPAEKLKKPVKKPMPEEPDVVAVVVFAEDCPVKFQEDPGKAMQQHRTGKRLADQKTGQADELLDKARDTTDDKQKAGQTVEAISKLRSALIDDPYHAEATYKLAHAYARARRKGCAVALLKRLNDLERYGDFAADAKRKKDEAESDPVFQPFRKDANGALNR